MAVNIMKKFVQRILTNPILTQKQIAFCLGVSQSLISRWKNGKGKITAMQFGKLCAVLGYTYFD